MERDVAPHGSDRSHAGDRSVAAGLTLTTSTAKCSNQRLFRSRLPNGSGAKPRPSRGRLLPRVHDETHFPTLEDQACAHARLSRAHEDGGRPQGAVRPPGEGPRPPHAGLGRAPPIAAPDPIAAPVARARRGTKPYRLSGAGAFEAIFDRGLRREGRYVQLVYVTVDGDATGRFGFVVGRKVLSRAVDRNRFKRIVRTRMRALRDAAARYDVVIRVKRPVPRDAVDAAAGEAVALIERLLGPVPAT
jgi:ribonuclease P protein component